MGVEFLEVLTVDEALGKVFELIETSERRIERVPIAESWGRVCACDIRAPEDLPGFPRSAMDGYAVRASDTRGATESLPACLEIKGEVPMGKATPLVVARGEALAISTGGVLPEGADAVVMLEHTGRLGSVLEVYEPVAPGENVVLPDEDLKKGTLVVAKGDVICSRHVGALAAIGMTAVEVHLRPRVGVISTGDELVPPEEPPTKGKVRDVNTYALSAALHASGCIPVSYGIAPDRLEAMLGLAGKALCECDALLISGGSSAGARDLTVSVISALGPPGIVVHGLRLKPGKPTILGVCGGRLVAGMPGNPASALTVFEEVISPILSRIKGGMEFDRKERKRMFRARISRSVSSAPGSLEIVPVTLSEESGELLAHPVMGKSNLIGTMARADGFVRVAPGLEGLEAFSEVDVELSDI